MIKIAINGLGRIGRLVLRAALERGQHFNIVALNTLGNAETICHLINYDSNHGRANINIALKGCNITIGDKLVPMLNIPTPIEIPWGDFDIDVVLECSGKFTNYDQAYSHIVAGAKKVIVSAPCENADRTIVVGVNHHTLKKEDKIISLGSCTTNALAPIAKVIYESFGIETGYVTTIHSYTSDQNIVDSLHNDLRRARAAALSIIPTSTGAASAISLVIPELKGKLHGSAIRVPIANVSLIDFSFLSRKVMNEEMINDAISKAASHDDFKNILGIATSKLVSIDFNHSTYSSIFDPFETKVTSPHFGRVLSWYDNEWAFVQRMLDCCELLKIPS